jgi:fibronectin type 3 domain-containing protein
MEFNYLDTVPSRPISPIRRVSEQTQPVILQKNLTQGPTTLPPAPQIASPLVGTATGFQFSFNQVTVPPGQANVIAYYRVYRNNLNVFSRNLVHTITANPSKTGAIVFTDTIVPAAGLNYYYWITSVDTFGNESLPQQAQSGTVVGSAGSTPFSTTSSFAYTSTTTSISWFWDGTNGSTTITIYRADNKTTGPISGNQTITGLTPGTTYNFYPYWDEPTQTLQWVTGGTGTPAYAISSAGSKVAVQQQNLRTRIPLSIGGMQAATPASGSGSGSGGGGGGGGGCFTGEVKVRTPYGLMRFDEMEAHLEIENLTGTHPADLVIHEDYSGDMIDMNGGLVTPGHRLKLGEKWVRAEELLATSMKIAGWTGTVYNLHILSDNPEDHHYILENGLVAHNLNKF